MIRQAERTIARHGMFRPGDRVGVAVSGGPDSVALLHALRELADKLGITLSVVHLNHQIRGEESDEDERFVTHLAETLGLKPFVSSADVLAEAQKSGENVEQVARNCRFRWFTRLMDRGFIDKIALGHTQSDQAETVLYRFLRGSGSAGLAGIRPILGGRVVRPLLEVSREQVLAYLEAGGYAWRVDSSNFSEDFARNRIRHKLMPQLVEEWNPNLPVTLARMAEWARDEEDYWSEAVQVLVARHLEARPDGVYLRATDVAGLPTAALRRLLRAAVERARGSLLGIEYEHIESLRRLIVSNEGGGRVQLPALEARRSLDQVRLTGPGEPDRKAPATYTIEIDLAAKGSYPVPGSRSIIRLNLYDRAKCGKGYNGDSRCFLDWETLPKPLQLRNWRPGDCYRPKGRRSPRKIKGLLQERGVVAWDRPGWPVISAAVRSSVPSTSRSEQTKEVIVWARCFGPCADFVPSEKSRRVLEIREISQETANFSESDLSDDASIQTEAVDLAAKGLEEQ